MKTFLDVNTGDPCGPEPGFSCHVFYAAGAQ